MKTYTILVAATCCLVLSCLTAAAQAPPELKAFQEAAGQNSNLFRGKQAIPYDRRANGNPYWSSDTFVPGEIVLEGIFYDDILVNIDAVAGQALVRKEDSPLAVSLSPDTVSSIKTGDSVFVGLGQDETTLPEGFYEVFGEGPERVYKHVSKRLLDSTQSKNGDAIGYYDPNYNTNLTAYFAITKTYYFRDSDGVFTKFRSKGALLRKFPERRKEIRKALSASGMDLPGVNFDSYCKEVLKIAAR